MKNERRIDSRLRLVEIGRHVCFCSDTPEAPKPDPLIGEAAKANADIGREALALSRQVYEESKPRQAKMDALAERVVKSQEDISNTNQSQANEQWNRFKAIFAPVEEKMADEAMTYDSAEEKERLAGAAKADVEQSFDAAQEAQERNNAALGVNPNSGRAASLSNRLAIQKAALTAGAMNNARTVARDKGITLRAGAANFGRNMPNTAANAFGIALQGGNNAVGNTSAANNMALQSATAMNQGFGTAASANNSAGNLMLGQYGTGVGAWNAQRQADAAGTAGIGQLVGQLGAAAILKPSSKQIKTNKQEIDDAEILEEVKSLPVERWDYKLGEGDGGRHVGPYAEDVQRRFGDVAAPGGKVIDVISMNGIALSAVKSLAKKVDNVETAVSKLAKAGMKRSA